MCIVLLSTSHPTYPLILLSNRDEFLNRSTLKADWWDTPNGHVLGGRDLQRKERGTWLAITKQGRIAALTNFREDGDQNKTKDKSRGGIVNAYLTSSPDSRENPQEFARRLIEEFGVNDVGGFSLLFGELRAPKKEDDGTSFPGLSILSNRSTSPDSLITIATHPGETHGLSNSHFGDLSWPKVVHGEELLKQAIAADVERQGNSQDHFIESLFDILSVDMLPERREGEPWDTYVLQMRNSIFIPPVGGPAVESTSADKVASGTSGSGCEPMRNGAGITNNGEVEIRTEAAGGAYGTQKQTVILVDQGGKVKFIEQTLYVEGGRRVGRREGKRVFEFGIEGWES